MEWSTVSIDDVHPLHIPDVLQKIFEKNDVLEDTVEDISGVSRARRLYKEAVEWG